MSESQTQDQFDASQALEDFEKLTVAFTFNNDGGVRLFQSWWHYAGREFFRGWLVEVEAGEIEP